MSVNSKIIYVGVIFLYIYSFWEKNLFTRIVYGRSHGLRIWRESNRSLMNKIILIYNFHNRLIYIIEYQILHEKTYILSFILFRVLLLTKIYV